MITKNLYAQQSHHGCHAITILFEFCIISVTLDIQVHLHALEQLVKSS